jgi:hypothetical protein
MGLSLAQQLVCRDVHGIVKRGFARRRGPPDGIFEPRGIARERLLLRIDYAHAQCDEFDSGSECRCLRLSEYRRRVNGKDDGEDQFGTAHHATICPSHRRNPSGAGGMSSNQAADRIQSAHARKYSLACMAKPRPPH